MLPPGRAVAAARSARAAGRHGVTTLWLTAGLFHQMVEARLAALAGVRSCWPAATCCRCRTCAGCCGAARGAADQRLRSDREHDLHLLPPVSGRDRPAGRRCRSAGRSPTRRRYVLDAAGSRCPGRAGRAVHRRRRAGARLPGPPGADGGALRARPVRRPAGARLYRTGDLVRWLPDGRAGVPGPDRPPGQGARLPHRARARSRPRCAAHPAVREAVVLAREDAPGDRRLVAYVGAGARGGAGSRRSCASYLRRAAAGLHGAVGLRAARRAAADAQRQGGPQGAAGSASRPGARRGRLVAPRTPAEELLAGIWAEVLGPSGSGATTTSSTLGGHSLLATRVVSRVREPSRRRAAAARPVRGADGGRARALDRAARPAGGRRPAPPPLAPVPRDGAAAALLRPAAALVPRPARAGQRRPTTSRSPCASAARSTWRPSPAASPRSSAATRCCARRSPSRRRRAGAGDRAPAAGCALAGGRPRRACRPAARERAGAGSAEAEALRPFDLARGPLLRALLLRAGADEHVLLLLTCTTSSPTAGRSGVLVRELAALYAAVAGGPAVAAAGAADPVRGLRGLAARLAGGRGAGAAARLLARRLAGAPALLELPTDRPRAAVPTSAGGQRVACRCPAGLARRCAALAGARAPPSS